MNISTDPKVISAAILVDAQAKHEQWHKYARQRLLWLSTAFLVLLALCGSALLGRGQIPEPYETIQLGVWVVVGLAWGWIYGYLSRRVEKQDRAVDLALKQAERTAIRVDTDGSVSFDPPLAQ